MTKRLIELARLVTLDSQGKTPPREFRIFSWGANDTAKGVFFLTRASAQELMLKYNEHGVDLMLDYEHLSLNPEATPEQRKRSGSCELEVRDDGLWITNITWTPQADQYLRNGEFRYLSPAFNVDDGNNIVELINVALTNLPATHNIEALVAASSIQKPPERRTAMTMKEHLMAALEKHGGHEGLSKYLGMDSEHLSKCLGGEAMDHEEMSACLAKLGVDPKDCKETSIDAAYNGQDVNHSTGGGEGLFATGAEAVVPHDGDEASEDQNGTVKMSRVEAAQLVTNSKELIKLRGEVDTQVRLSLLEKSRKKLNPRLIALAKKISTKDLPEFLAAIPEAQVELHEPQPTGLAGGRRMVTLTKDDKEVAKLTGKTEAEFAKIKEDLGIDESTIMLAGQRAYEGRKPAPAADKAEKSAWDRKYADHFVTLSITDRTPDGKRWKPAAGSKFVPASKLED